MNANANPLRPHTAAEIRRVMELLETIASEDDADAHAIAKIRRVIQFPWKEEYRQAINRRLNYTSCIVAMERDLAKAEGRENEGR